MHNASLTAEGELHVKKRYPSVIKFYNFLRSNKAAPVKVKTKVLRSCVMHSLLHNSDTFGYDIPKELESAYIKLLKSCFNVRSNTPNYILYVESGFIPLKFVVLLRQFNFYKRFQESIFSNSRREKMMNILLENSTKFLQHYTSLMFKYDSVVDIVEEGRNFVKDKICSLAHGGHSKYAIYLKINPNLEPSPFLVSAGGRKLMKRICVFVCLFVCLFVC